MFCFNMEVSSDDIKEKLHYVATNISVSVKKYLSMSVSIGLGRVYPHISKLSNSYQEAMLALRYRIYKDSDTVLFIEDLEAMKKKEMIIYPRPLEMRIVESLKVGDTEQAEQTLFEFSMSVSLFQSYKSIYQCFHLLLSSIILSLEKQGSSMTDIFESDLFGQLKSMQTSEEINKWFVESVFPLYQAFSDDREESSGSLAVKKTCQFINKNISEDITLTDCADMVGLTPSYLSRIFKKEVGINFQDYVLIRKVEVAKSMCLETDSRVSEIAEAVGYSERNLTRLFKRYVKMTISQYRESQR